MSKISRLIPEMLHRKEEVGVEIEIEGRRLGRFREADLQDWRVDTDGSLRDGVELVLRNPCYLKDLRKKLNDVLKAKKDHEIVISRSDRTGIFSIVDHQIIRN